MEAPAAGSRKNDNDSRTEFPITINSLEVIIAPRKSESKLSYLEIPKMQYQWVRLCTCVAALQPMAVAGHAWSFVKQSLLKQTLTLIIAKRVQSCDNHSGMAIFLREGKGAE
jgi:hypothetical protein